MISVEEKRAAYEEARQLLLLGKKWQQLMPGERKPDFRRAAKAVIRRALGKSTVPREPDLRVHSGLMHEHDAREASLIERTLRNGIVHPRTALVSARRAGKPGAGAHRRANRGASARSAG
jgi:hypothetical protein